jgi:hypothetical protein
MEPTQQETIERNEAETHQKEKTSRANKKQVVPALKKSRAVKKSTANGGVTQDPQTHKVLSFTYVTPNGKRGSYAILVDAKISKEEMAAIMDKKAKGGEILKAQLIPYAPKA